MSATCGSIRIAFNNASLNAGISSGLRLVISLSSMTDELRPRAGPQRSAEAAFDHSRLASEQAATLQRYGRSDFFTSLEAERTMANAQQALAGSDAALAANQVALFRALGGGWGKHPCRARRAWRSERARRAEGAGRAPRPERAQGRGRRALPVITSGDRGRGNSWPLPDHRPHLTQVAQACRSPAAVPLQWCIKHPTQH